ncbi:MAG: YerC/YecD family TrpR-related protein [bacterium]
MEKYQNLSLATQKELLENLCDAILFIKNKDEAVKLLVDLLTKEEVMKLAKRIKIAELLLKGMGYYQIRHSLQTSEGTIAKVAGWLNEGGEGFRLFFERKKISKEKYSHSERFDILLNEWKRIKRRNPMMFWPSILIDNLVASADKKEKEKIFQSIQKLNRKSKIYKEVSKFLVRDK